MLRRSMSIDAIRSVDADGRSHSTAEVDVDEDHLRSIVGSSFFVRHHAMEVFLQSVEADLRNLSSESRKPETLAGQLAGWLVSSEHPEVKVAAERAILKLRALGRQNLTKDVFKNSKELLRPFLLACETKHARLTVLALGCVQKLLANDAVSEEGTVAIITTLQHVERSGDEHVKLKMLQIVLTLVQDTTFTSTDHLANVLGVCFRILAHSRNTDTVLNTAAATIRQVVAVVFQSVTTDPEESKKRENTNEAALLLLEDLCHLANGSPAIWLQSPAVPQSFALDLIEFILANKLEIFQTLTEFRLALGDHICRALQQLLSEAFETDGDPPRGGAHRVTFKVVSCLLSRYYVLIPRRLAQMWHSLCAGASSPAQIWRQVLCLQALKTCVSEPRELYYLYETYDMTRDCDILAVERVVDVTVDLLRPRKRSLGGEDDRKMTALAEEKVSTPASAEEPMDEATPCLLALEILLKITNAIHLLSEQCIHSHQAQGKEGAFFLRHVCCSMLDRFWQPFFTVFQTHLSSGNCSETVVLMILKGYQDILRSAASFELLQAGDHFLQSLCRISVPSPHENGGQSEVPTLSSLNVHAVRTLLNVVHQLGNVLGSSWTSVVTTLYQLDGILTHTVTNKESRTAELGTETDVAILETSLKHLFDGTSDLCTEAVVCLLSSLRDVSLQSLTAAPAKYRRPSFCMQHMVGVLLNNLDRVHDLWGIFLAHVIEVLGTHETTSWTVAIDALDRAVLGILEDCRRRSDDGALENMVLVALESLFSDASHRPIRIGLLRISLHVLQRSGEDLSRGWEPVLRLLQSVPDAGADGEVITAAFDSVELLINEYLDQLPTEIQSKSLRVVSSFAKQTSVMNVSLTSINLLWAAVDMFGKEAKPSQLQSQGSFPGTAVRVKSPSNSKDHSSASQSLFYLIIVLQELSLDKRPEVRNSGIRSFFAAMVSYGSKFCLEEWNRCLADVLLPLLKSVYYISMTSSSAESEAVELGKEKGRSIKMLMHYSRNTERKQWEETMVLALNGLCKILRLYLPLLLGLTAFSNAWEQIAVICKNSLAQGTKDTALAAIALIIQVSETFGASQTQLPTQTMTSILRSLDESMELVTLPESLTPAMVKVELVKAVGSIAHSTKRILPESSMPMFIEWLQRLACVPYNSEEAAQNVPDVLPVVQKETLSVVSAMPIDASDPLWIKVLEALCSFLYPHGMEFGRALCLPPRLSSCFHTGEASSSPLWLTQIVEQLEKLFLSSLSKDLQLELFSTVVASLTRCMASGFLSVSSGTPLWIKAASLFRSVLDVGLSSMPQDGRHGHEWLRCWEMIAHAFEAVFSGKHITVKDAEAPPFSSLTASELKLSLLDVLSDVIISSHSRMADATLRRLITLIDGTISLHNEDQEDNSPAGNLCHSCLRKLFVLCSQSNDPAISIIALPLFVARCKAIMTTFAQLDAESSNTHLSLVRVGEVIFALEMLSSLRTSPTVVESLLVDYPIFHKMHPSRTASGSLRRSNSSVSWLGAMRRPHLLLMYDTLCDCVTSKEAHVRALASELLKSVGQDVGLMSV